MPSELERLYLEMKSEQQKRDTKKLCYGDFYKNESSVITGSLGGLFTLLIIKMFFPHTCDFVSGLIMLAGFLCSIFTHGFLGLLFHRLFLKKHPKTPKLNEEDLNNPNIVLAVIAWQEKKFDDLKNEAFTRVKANIQEAEQNKAKTESSLCNLTKRLREIGADLKPIYEERITCANILIQNFSNEITEAATQLKSIQVEEQKIQKILTELHFYYDDADASFVLQEAKKANIAIIQEREAIDGLIAKLIKQSAVSTNLLVEIRDGKKEKAAEAAAMMEVGYSADLDLEHPGHETQSISLGK